MARKPVRNGPSQPKQVRCAIYTRKSTEEGLEQAFNSLDAQREACAAYIVSQRHEGWVPVPDIYDDGGFSGGNMERPGLKRLLAEVEAGRVDVIVVYKVDRLTRSLSDFARIVDVLDDAGASFVSITQSFNTTTSMGRLTLNVLLSFAQFEREVTGERIRDKIAQSKAKGMWMGGTVPLGYDVRDRKLVINEAEATTVRHIYSRYLALGCGQLLIEELRRDGYRTKHRPQTSGRGRGGVPFERGSLFYLLSNRMYLGEIGHKGKHFSGEHPAILDHQLWTAVQAQIERNRTKPARPNRRTESSLLTGLVTDGEGRRMTPTHAVKGARRYRYYVTHSAELVRDSAPAWRVPAHDLETVVVTRLKALFTDRRELRRLVNSIDQSAAALHLAFTTGTVLAGRLDAPEQRRSLVTELVTSISLTELHVAIGVSSKALLTRLRICGDEHVAQDDDLLLVAPATRQRAGKEVRLLIPGGEPPRDLGDTKLLAMFAEALTARETLLANPERTVEQMAREMGVCRVRLGCLLRLAFTAPAIIQAVAEPDTKTNIAAEAISKVSLPLCWSRQRALLGSYQQLTCSPKLYQS